MYEVSFSIVAKCWGWSKNSTHCDYLIMQGSWFHLSTDTRVLLGWWGSVTPCSVAGYLVGYFSKNIEEQETFKSFTGILSPLWEYPNRKGNFNWVKCALTCDTRRGCFLLCYVWEFLTEFPAHSLLLQCQCSLFLRVKNQNNNNHSIKKTYIEKDMHIETLHHGLHGPVI